MLQGLAELNRNLKLVKTFTEIELITAMERGQNLVATNAKENHVAAQSLSPAELKSHPDPRFYSHSSKLVNSIHPEKVKVSAFGLEGDVTAGEKYATKIEVGGPNSRAFPFFGPALIGTAPAVIELFALAVKKVIK